MILTVAVGPLRDIEWRRERGQEAREVRVIVGMTLDTVLTRDHPEIRPKIPTLPRILLEAGFRRLKGGRMSPGLALGPRSSIDTVPLQW